MHDHANWRCLWEWYMRWHSGFLQMWMSSWFWNQASNDSSIQTMTSFIYLIHINLIKLTSWNNYIIKLFNRFVWILMNALLTHFYVAVGVVLILQVIIVDFKQTIAKITMFIALWLLSMLNRIFTLGSFVCECPLGLELTEDGKRCKVKRTKYMSIMQLIQNSNKTRHVF